MAANRRNTLLVGGFALAALVIGIVGIQLWAGRDRFGSIEEASGDWAYLAVFLLVFGDAVCALFPGETTLNTASALAANGTLDLALVMPSGPSGRSVATWRSTGSSASTGEGSRRGSTRRRGTRRWWERST